MPARWIRQSLLKGASARILFTIGIVALAGGIFLFDVFTPIEVSGSIFYVFVVLVAALAYSRTGIVLVGLACEALTVLSHMLSPGDPWAYWPLLDRVIGIIGIAMSTLLVVRNRSAAETLAEQANLLNLTHDSIFTRDAKNVITYWNGGAEALYGWTAAAAVGKTLDQLIPTNFPMPLQEIMRMLLASGRWEGSLVRTRQDGSAVTVAARWSIQHDAQGRFAGILETNNDVTERQRAEDALARSEAYLAEAQRLSLTGSIGWRDPHAEHFWSRETARIYEYEWETIKPGLEAMLARTHPDDRALVRRKIDEAFADRLGFELEHRLLMPAGAVRFVQLVTRATEERDGMVRFVGAVMDITAAKRALDDLQRVQSELARITRVTTMGQIAASIAHEINQPLTGVVTNGHTVLHWLNEKTLNLDKARVTAERVVRDGERASGVIQRVQGLLTKTPPQVRDVDINDLIDEVLELLQTELRVRGIAVRTELSPALPPVLGDSVQLQQVLLNLVINGTDAMAEVTGRPKTLVIGSRASPDGDGLVFVRDHGSGLDEETAAKIFDPFFTTKAKGMGMGLAICRSIIEAHGGRLWATPAEPHGALFQFTVPNRVATEA
jgi:PAS domain S-box-containing protein